MPVMADDPPKVEPALAARTPVQKRFDELRAELRGTVEFYDELPATAVISKAQDVMRIQVLRHWFAQELGVEPEDLSVIQVVLMCVGRMEDEPLTGHKLVELAQDNRRAKGRPVKSRSSRFGVMPDKVTPRKKGAGGEYPPGWEHLVGLD